MSIRGKKLLVIILSLVSMAVNASDNILNCPRIEQLKENRIDIHRFSYYAINDEGKLFSSNQEFNRHPAGYMWSNFKPMKINDGLTYYDAEQKALHCVYDILEFDPATPSTNYLQQADLLMQLN